MDSKTISSYLDTNVLIYLHSGNIARLSQRAVTQIERSQLLISGMVLPELEMLLEKGALHYSASQILSDLNQQIGVSVCQLPLVVVMNSAMNVRWTREPSDRVIVANALANNEAPLITSDRRMQAHYCNAIW